MVETPPAGIRAALPAPNQAHVYRKYLALQTIAGRHWGGSLAGRLVLCPGFGVSETELALAAVIAGAGFLGIDPQPQRLKAAVRNGACNFMVTTLDEALRVLKNELRKRKPLSVGLLGSAGEILPAMIERGVQPDLIALDPVSAAASGPDAEAQAAVRRSLLQLIERGALPANMEHGPGTDRDDDPGSIPVHWIAANPRDLQKIDHLSRSCLPSADRTRLRWLQESPAYFYRQTPLTRVLGMLPEELSRCLEAMSRADFRRSLEQPVTMQWIEGEELQSTQVEPLANIPPD